MTIRALFESLTGDRWRNEHPFSQEMLIAAKVINQPYATRREREMALAAWLQRHQSCRFGKLAAAQRSIRYCILTGKDLRQSDAAIAAKVREELLVWKQLAAAGGEHSPHSFLLLLAAPEIEFAAPDAALERLARKVAHLVAPNAREDIAGNDIRTQQLFLEHPTDGSFHAFDVILDFFASAGDGRWWHDHRIPAGVGFTLNSVGHMVRHQEWFEGMGPRTEWAVKQAMGTIDAAAAVPDGKATWLRPLKDGQPRKAAACPFAEPEKLTPALAGKDWTIYGGKYETDHSVRREFFDGSNETAARDNDAFLLDFAYMHRPGREADAALIGGIQVAPETVYAQISHRDDWRLSPRGKGTLESLGPERSAEDDKEITEALAQCGAWALADAEVAAID